MKWFLILWAGPVVFLGVWYELSYYDINFGLFFLSRQLHDLVFQIYGNILGIPPEELPGMVARAIGFDSCLVTSIVVFRRRRAIAAWWASRRQKAPGAADLKRAESLSSAP